MNWIKKFYLWFSFKSMQFFLIGLSRCDPVFQNESKVYPQDLHICLTVPKVGDLKFRHDQNGRLARAKPNPKESLNLQFKHPEFAWQIFTFRCSTEMSFARNQTTLTGELSYAMRYTRLLDRLLSLLLPGPIAKSMVKQPHAFSATQRCRLILLSTWHGFWSFFK